MSGPKIARRGFTGAILAGGASSRFGSDKALADWEGRPMILRILGILRPLFGRCLVVTKKPESFRPFAGPGVEVVADLSPDQNPLVGIATGLRRSAPKSAFVCACDLPLLQPGLIAALCDASVGRDAAAPLWRGWPEPLCAVYAPSCLPVLEPMLAEKGASAAILLRRVDTAFLPEAGVARADPRGLSFEDMDTLEDLRRLTTPPRRPVKKAR